jgi:glycine cleavage system H protein
MNPNDRRYSKEHEWIKLESDSAGLMGITHFAQDSLGDVVYLDLPVAGTHLEQAAKLGEVESVKAVSDIYAPVSGEVLEVNQEVVDHPEVVNEDPYGRGWLLRVSIGDSSLLDALLTTEQYEAFLEEAPH